MNDSGNNPKSLPPDDFSATVPNIKKPGHDFSEFAGEGGNDWEKTNYNYAQKDLKPEEWNKTAYNIPAAPPPAADFNKTYIPGAQTPPSNSPKEADWGMTQANIKIPSTGTPPPERRQENYSSRREPEYNATTPLIRLPENERQKYQNLPPAVAEEKAEENKKRGMPIWGWIVAVLLGAAFFALLLIAGIWYFVFNKRGFDIVVSKAPAGSDIRVNGATWNIRAEGGNYRLLNLKAGEKKIIEIKKEGVTCQPVELTGTAGETQTIIANCISLSQKPVETAGCDPSKFSSKDIQKSHDCAYEKLRALQPDFTVQQLLEAMNLYIINFDSGKFNIKPDDEKFLQASASYMKKLPPNVEIEVGGHTDNKGSNNQTLSNNRANAVRQALINAGVNKDILLPRGYAETKPKDTNDTEDGRFRNRRIEYSAIIR